MTSGREYEITLTVRALNPDEAQRMSEIARRALNRTLDQHGREMSARVASVRPGPDDEPEGRS